MGSPPVIHPIFRECETYTLDPFWKEIFQQCSRNRFPRGVRYDWKKNTLYVKLQGSSAGKPNVKVCKIPPEAPDAFEVVTSVFRELGLRSKRDMDLKREEIRKVRKERTVNLDCSWKEIKPKYMKDRMIHNFVRSLQEKYELDSRETKGLLNTIILGFQLKQIDSTDVRYEKGEILGIDSLEFSSEKRSFCIDRDIKRSPSNDKSSKSSKFFSTFEVYLREARKKRLRM